MIFLCLKVARWKKRNKIWTFLPKTECQVFVWFLYERKMSSSLQNTGSADSQWLKKLRRTVLKKVNTEWQEKKNHILLYVENYTYR